MMGGKIEESGIQLPDPEALREQKSLWRHGPAWLDPLIQAFDNRTAVVRANASAGQTAADLGCGWGHYAHILAKIVGPQGLVWAVDLDPRCTRRIERQAARRGMTQLRAVASTAADLSFIPDGSVDFVFANGLLCSMVRGRGQAMCEVGRILKPAGRAYLSLGAPPPWGFVDADEWGRILARFNVLEGGSYKQLWAVVAPKAA
ncbi:MAG: class I SAM-dependent methyltransferase [Anaerolineae bacterium]